MFRPALIALLRALLVAAIASIASIARADVLAEFDAATTAYREQRYAAAAAAFEGVIATAASNAADQAIVLEARKFLAACYLFMERPEDADGQFELLLELDPGYRVDPAVFPREFVDRFENVRRRVEAARIATLEAQLTEARAAIDEQRVELDLAHRRYSALHDFAAESLVVRDNSRLVALLPFGIGQFQNRNRRRGRWFAITEGIALAGYIGGYIWRRQVEDEDPDRVDQLRWERHIRSSLALNWSSGLAFLGLTVAGAVEAEANFVPRFESTRAREVPEQLRPIEPEVEAQLQLTPFGANFELRF